MDKQHSSINILIIANGEVPEKKILMAEVEKADILLAVNGGSNVYYKLNLHPNYIIGDLDSIDHNNDLYFKDSEFIRIVDQNRHDLHKALNFVKKLKPDKIIIFGAFGKRLDHSIANLILLQSTDLDCSIKFIDNFGQLSLIKKSQILEGKKDQTLSLFSFNPVEGLTLDGFKYPLKNVDFPNGFNGLSNITTTDQPQILFRKGSLFLYTIHDNTST
jgi:thiamine pyrophosphokinase